MHIEPYEGKPDVNRLIAAMRGEPTDRVPNFEILIEDQHVEELLGRPASNTLGVGGDPAKGSEASEGVRPMYPQDYLELCRVIGQDAIVLENLWTPIKRQESDGSIVLWNDRSFRSRDDLERVVWPGEAGIEEKLRYIRDQRTHGCSQAWRTLGRRLQPQHRQLHPSRELRGNDQCHPPVRRVLSLLVSTTWREQT